MEIRKKNTIYNHLRSMRVLTKTRKRGGETDKHLN